MRVAFVFPGQGSQSVGMGSTWIEAHPQVEQVFDRADQALDMPLKQLCLAGPAEELQLTANTQPAILTTSVAILEAISGLPIEPVLMAGHSLGEYSAHVAAGSLTFEEALLLVRRRGELMQKAVPVGRGAMAAVLGLEAESVAEIAAEAAGDDVCTVANFNAPTQTVLAGDRLAVERATRLAKERGARRAMILPVSAPFHSPLMRPQGKAWSHASMPWSSRTRGFLWCATSMLFRFRVEQLRATRSSARWTDRCAGWSRSTGWRSRVRSICLSRLALEPS